MELKKDITFMETLIMLGTGNAVVTKCYNTCFAIQREENYFLVFISHEHTDHLLGMVWLIRMIATQMKRNQYATMLRAKNIILYLTEDHNLKERKRLYTEEGKQYYAGNLLVPDDLEEIEL